MERSDTKWQYYKQELAKSRRKQRDSNHWWYKYCTSLWGKEREILFHRSLIVWFKSQIKDEFEKKKSSESCKYRSKSKYVLLCYHCYQSTCFWQKELNIYEGHSHTEKFSEYSMKVFEFSTKMTLWNCFVPISKMQ